MPPIADRVIANCQAALRFLRDGLYDRAAEAEAAAERDAIQYGRSTEPYALVMQTRAQRLIAEGKFSEAREVLNLALEIQKRNIRPSDELRNSWYLLASAAFAEKDFAAALAAHDQALEVCDRCSRYGINVDGGRALSLTGKAICLLRLSRHEEALQTAQDALELAEQIEKDEPGQFTSTACWTISTIFKEAHRYKRAKEFRVRAEEIDAKLESQRQLSERIRERNSGNEPAAATPATAGADETQLPLAGDSDPNRRKPRLSLENEPAEAAPVTTEPGGEAKATSLGADEEKPTLEEVLKEMDSFIGMDKAKEQVRQFAAFLAIQRLREERGIKSVNISYHFALAGSPGTGKTLIAHVIARVFWVLGILKRPEVIEASRAELVAGYQGQTAMKVNAVCDKALDAMLLIDEAYSLVRNDDDDFGSEAVATLIQRMENDRHRLVVAVAGYLDLLRDWINSNPGLKSRIPTFIECADYSGPELSRIFCKFAKDGDYVLTAAAKKKVEKMMDELVASKDRNFGNGRTARNIFEDAIVLQATRLQAKTIGAGKKTKVKLTDRELRTLRPEDIVLEAQGL